MGPNHEIVMFLKTRDIAVVLIRRCLVILTGKQHTELADEIGLSKANFTAHINGHRTNAIAQKQIGNYFGVSHDVLFENEVPELPGAKAESNKQ